MTATAAPFPVPKRPDSTADLLPDFVDLGDAPQLGPIALLQAALNVTRTALDLHHTSVSSVREAILYEPHCPVTFLAQLVSDRCRELCELLVCYRIALSAPVQHDFDGDVF